MAHESRETVTISIRRPTETPSVFVLGTFSDPAWEPLELSAKPVETPGDDAATEYVFSRDFEIPEGRYQYRFRVGSDDSWIHDEKVETGTFSSSMAALRAFLVAN